MRLRHIITAGASAALILGVGMAVAPPAAADQTITTDCTPVGDSTIEVTAVPGELITLFDNGSCELATSGPVQFVGVTGTYWVVTVADGTPGGTYVDGATLTRYGYPSVGGRVFVTFIVPGSQPPPEMWMQSSGRVEGALCPEGWAASWAEWPNGGTGGFVCDTFVKKYD